VKKISALMVTLSGLMLLLSAGVVQAGQSVLPERPKIAVVLAGGGAKGAAHVGVLKALEELHIPVDFVTGTSMGAYVGGLYAAGMSADEIEAVLESEDWYSGYKDRVDRSERRVRDKAYEDYFQIATDLGLHWGELRSPRGMVQGQAMLRILRETSGNLPYMESFDALPIPFRAVATDIVALEEVVLGSGLLTDAMMASMSVPGALPPYELDGRLLVDGGVTNNMPVELARELGADVVIAVDISTDYLQKEQVTDFIAVANQLSNFLVRRTTAEQAALLGQQDVLLQPAVGGMETTEFDKMPLAYQWGYQSAQQSLVALQRYSLSAGEYQAYVEQKQQRRRRIEYGDELTVDQIVLNNNSHYRNSLLLDRLELEAGEPISTEELEESVRSLYALDRFERIDYHFEKQDDETSLFVNVNEKNWGPNYIHLRFFLEEDFDSDSQYGLGVSTNFTGLNSVGGELKVNLELGTDRIASLQWASPLFVSQQFFHTASITYRNDSKNSPIEGLNGDTTLAMSENSLPTTYTEFEGELALGYQPTLWQEAKIGYRYLEGDLTLTNLEVYGEASYHRRGLFAHYRLDTLDDFSLPTEGILLDLEYMISDDSISGLSQQLDDLSDNANTFQDDRVHEISASARGAYSWGDHTLVAQVEYGSVEDKTGDNPAIQPKELGGFLRLSGIPKDSLSGQNLFFNSLVYRYRWFENDFGLFTAPVYLGASLEYGGVWNDVDLTPADAPLYHAGSLFAGIKSPIGPIVFALGATEEGYESVYLTLGQAF
jgi:NTE family protein